MHQEQEAILAEDESAVLDEPTVIEATIEEEEVKVEEVVEEFVPPSESEANDIQISDLPILAEDPWMLGPSPIAQAAGLE